MNSRYLAIGVGALLLVGLGIFGTVRILSAHIPPAAKLVAAKSSTCRDTYRLLKLPPSMTAAATPNCLRQSLQVTGELHGSIAEAYTADLTSAAPASMCSAPKRWSNFPSAGLDLSIGSRAYLLVIAPSGTTNKQAVNFSAAGKVELISIADPKAEWNQASGSFTVAAEGVSGTIDADLERDVNGARPVHISGQWACGVAMLPQFDATVPCANFYALNQLPAADVARMKAGECNAQDLNFSGDVVGQVTAGVTDLAGPHGWFGLGGDNLCSTAGDQFVATVKFSIADETFQLLLHAEAPYGSQLGAGQYAADPATYGIRLYLGSADPTQQGFFFADENSIFWEGRSGSFTIGADMKSGTVDADLQAPLRGTTVRVSGNWRCAA